MMRMAVPMTIAQLVNVLYNITDRFFIGHIGSGASDGLTGVGIVFPIISLITAFTNLFGMGGAPLCAIARGKKDTFLAERIMGTTCYMLFITAVIMTSLGLVLCRPCSPGSAPVQIHTPMPLIIFPYTYWERLLPC